MSGIQLVAPKIREPWSGQGGLYGGLFEPRDGSRPYRLVVALANVLPRTRWGKLKSIIGATSESDGLSNTRAILEADPANAITKTVTSLEVDGHKDFYSPATLELAQLRVTMGDLIFDAIDGCRVWSSTQHPGHPGYAWVTHFGGGNTGWGHKGSEYAALAVRRVFE